LRIYPVLIDSRPTYLGSGASARSLLLTPAGASSLFNHLYEGLAPAARNPVTVVTTFEPDQEYEEALRQESDAVDGVCSVGQFTRRLQGFKPSDWLLLRDARRVAPTPLDLDEIIAGIPDDPRWVRHIVALATPPAGTNERVLLDPEGRVSRIQRYYDNVTWSFASGVSCSLLPVSSALLVRNLPFASLPELRAALAGRAVPSRDLFLKAAVFDLAGEAGLLGLNERLALAAAARTQPLGKRVTVAATARIQGPVVVQDDVVIEEGATVIGPAVLGRGCRVGRQATVVQCLVAPAQTVAAEATVHHRLVVDDPEPIDSAVTPPLSFSPPAGGWGALSEEKEKGSRPLYPILKAPLDILLATIALILVSPLFIVLAILVRLDSKGPILFGDRREGRGGKGFRCWKFRTMIVGADAKQLLLQRQNQVDGPQFKMEHDPRVTRIGRWLRPLSLDELPQLLNVLLGEMSFVGPRPSPFRENQMCVPWREARLSVRPGITGLWQVCRHDRSFGDFHQWIYYDLLYVRHMSLLVDVKIFLATIITLGGKTSVPLDWILDRQSYNDRRRARRAPDDHGPRQPAPPFAANRPPAIGPGGPEMSKARIE
jgi:lipopolysaccharide/colanic/teichoic acid biosynthesis glycosyltransferase